MIVQRLLFLILPVLLSGCSTYQPTQVNDVCRIFWGDTDWYEDARRSSKRWGTPIGVMMAIIKQESAFQAKVRPDRPKFLFIPLPRRSSAYGYAQAQDAAWSDYRKETGHWSHDRDDFGDAINFVGCTPTSPRSDWASPNGIPTASTLPTMRVGVAILASHLIKSLSY